MSRIRPHITEREAHCRCSCGKVTNDGFLTIIDALLSRYGKPCRINCMVRCDEYNTKIGGSKTSGHLENKHGYGAADLRCNNPIDRAIMLPIAIFYFDAGIINHIEVCDGHLHVAKVPLDHPHAGKIHWGKSK